MLPKRPLTLVDDIRPLAEAHGWAYHEDADGQAVIDYVDSSRSLPEDVASILHDPQAYSQAHYAREWKAADFILEKYLVRLYAVSPEVFPTVFTCEIPDVTLLTNYGVALYEGSILAQSTVFRDRKDAKILTLHGRTKLPVTLLDEKWVSLQSYSALNYAHWITDCLPRLMLLDESHSDWKVIIPHNAHSFHRETLALLGIASERIYEVSENNQNITVERFILCHTAKSIARAHVVLMKRLRARMWAAAGVSDAIPTRRLYVSRAKAARPVVNEAELLPILAHHGFEVIDPGDYAVAEQVRMFAEASVIAGAHGAGLYNCIFSRPGLMILEMFNRRRSEFTVHRIGSIMGHTHWHMFADNLSDQWHTYADPQKFERWLAVALYNEKN